MLNDESRSIFSEQKWFQSGQTLQVKLIPQHWEMDDGDHWTGPRPVPVAGDAKELGAGPSQITKGHANPLGTP